VELQANKSERAEMEEQLSNAFGTVIRELQARINALTAERDGALSAHKGGGRGAKPNGNPF